MVPRGELKKACFGGHGEMRVVERPSLHRKAEAQRDPGSHWDDLWGNAEQEQA